MKKIKQILAILVIVILVALYLSTLIFALLDSENAANLFKASIYSTIVLPTLLWIYTAVYRWTRKHNNDEKDN